MTDFRALAGALAESGVEFVLIGEAASTAQGSLYSKLVSRLDVLYRRTPDNLARVVNSLAEHHPYLRGAPAGLPFHWDVETLHRGLDFTLATDLGSIDLMGEMVGGGGYEALVPKADTLTLFGLECRCLSIHQLIGQARGRTPKKILRRSRTLKRSPKSGDASSNVRE
jgi:hypothetical protein